MVGKKVIAVFTDRCFLKKRNYFLANPIKYKMYIKNKKFVPRDRLS